MLGFLLCVRRKFLLNTILLVDYGNMGKDYYKVLGVARDASDEELKKA